MNRHGRAVVAVPMLSVPAAVAAQALPDAIAVKGATVVLRLHAEGAQIYECKTASRGQLIWQFREPTASLFQDGANLGRHYAGPSWEGGGSILVAKPDVRAPGGGPRDIPWLKLEVTERRGDGPLKDVTTVQRIDTQGGNTDRPMRYYGANAKRSGSATALYRSKGSRKALHTR